MFRGLKIFLVKLNSYIPSINVNILIVLTNRRANYTDKLKTSFDYITIPID